jgi:hypothetical protein
MNVRLGLALVVLCVPVSAHAEMMVTSSYRAKAPHIAAHRTLPIGTELIITNQRNGRSGRIVIGTRGPFVRGRSLDISDKLAKELGFWEERRPATRNSRGRQMIHGSRAEPADKQA